MQIEHLNCPQCGKLSANNAYRIIRDTCGHQKCRGCLLQDVEGCKQCSKNEKESPEHELSILQNVSDENQHTSVITYNNNKHSEALKNDSELLNEENIPYDSGEEISNGVNLEDTSTLSESSTSTVKSKLGKVKRNYKVIRIPAHVSLEGEPPTYKCTFCGSKFKTKSHVKYHIFCNGEKKSFTCNVCPKTYALKSQLEIHKLVHLGIRKFVCKTCGKSFIQAGKLKRHMVLHSNEKPHVCDECGKSFRAISSLKFHRVVHTGEKPFNCNICDKKFNNSSNLKKHMISHTDDKSHMCEQCGKKFKQKWSLVSHRKTHSHRNEYSCEVCDKTFTDKKNLKRHQECHLDSKIFSCGLCSISFRRKDNLNRHIKNAHPDKNPEIIEKRVERRPSVLKSVVDNPNAINVITVSPIARKADSPRDSPVIKHRTTINGPLKLAFKTSAFKKNYNINREGTFDSNSKGEASHASINKLEDKCDNKEKQDPPQMKLRNSPPRIFRDIFSAPTFSVKDMYDNRPDVIKNIKFKIPENFPVRDESLLKAIIPQINNRMNVNNGQVNILTHQKMNDTPKEVQNGENGVAATSVIVNSCDQKRIHWRRRMSQNLALRDI